MVKVKRKNPKPTARFIALNILSDVIMQHRSLTECLTTALGQCQHAKDQAFIQELSFGVCRFYYQLEWYKQKLLKKPLKRKDSDIEITILLGLYQLIFMRVPDHAAIAETVNLANFLNKDWARGLINALLREFLRNKNSLLNAMQSSPRARTAHPTWLLDELKQAWPHDWQAICLANNRYPPLTLRINQQKITRADYLKQLTEQGYQANITQYSNVGIELLTKTPISELPGFQQGLFSVQDEAAQLAAPLLQLQPQMRVLDACCAPGGKTSHILEIQPQLADCLAIDNNAVRLAKVADNLKRLQLSADLICTDCSNLSSWWNKQEFDRILLDVPCSATGVIRRHPDIKLLRRQQDITNLREQQINLLHSIWPTLKQKGLLLYITCSILPAENQHVLKTFLSNIKNAQEIPLDNLAWGRKLPLGRQILPGDDNLDGFYFCLLQKI